MSSKVPGAPASCSYDLDEEFRLVAVDQGWKDFALANDAPELLPPAPLGRSVLRSISDITTAHIYQELYQRSLKSGRPVRFGIRCDSPRVRRHLMVTILPLHAGLRVITELVRSEPNPGGEILLNAPRKPDGWLQMCSWCHRVQIEGNWHELDEAVPRLNLFEQPAVPVISHTICETCNTRMHELMNSL